MADQTIVVPGIAKTSAVPLPTIFEVITNITIVSASVVSSPLLFKLEDDPASYNDTEVTRPDYRVYSGDPRNKKKESTYSDFSLDNFVHPNTGDATKVYDVAAIRQSIKNLVRTNHFERPFNPLIGGNVDKSLFEMNDFQMRTKLRESIELTIKSYEPRAILNKIDVTTGQDEKTVTITITFTPINSARQESVNIFLQQVR